MLRMAPIIRSIEAEAWIRKYLLAASVDRGFAFLMRIGMIDNMFISRPTQIMSQ